MSRLTVILASMLVLSCSRNNLSDYNRLGGFRVLAIKADAPETSPGSSVTVTPVISDLDGRGRPIAYFVQGCTDPGVGYGATPNCSSASDTVTLASGTIALSGSSYTAAAGAVTFTVPSTILEGKSAAAQLAGVAYLVVYNLTAPGGASQTAFKRVYASTSSTKNTNPSLTDLTADGSGFTSMPTHHVTVTPTISPGSAESYSGQTEILTTTWFVSEGTFDRQRTEGFATNGYSPGTRSADHAVVVVVVTRDNRGGEDYIIRAL